MTTCAGIDDRTAQRDKSWSYKREIDVNKRCVPWVTHTPTRAACGEGFFETRIEQAQRRASPRDIEVAERYVWRRRAQ